VWSLGDILLVAAGFGILAGAIEAAAALVRQRVMHRILYMGPDLVWQLPLVDVAVFLGVGLVLALASLAWPRLRAPRVVLAVFATLTVLSALLLLERVHAGLLAVLAAGLGVALSRVLLPRREGLRRATRIGAPVVVLLLLLAPVALGPVRVARERRAVAAHPVRSTGQPNILVLVLDAVRAWDLSIYGYGRRTTPKLEQWAAQGAVFERALAPASSTALSHAVMWTGRHPSELSVDGQSRFLGEYPTLAEVLRDAGYATAGFAGNYLNVGRGTGLAAGFVHYEDYPLRLIPTIRQTSMLGRLLGVDRAAALVGRRRMLRSVEGSQLNDQFLRWLDGQEARPWFAFLNYADALGPYLPPEPFASMYAGKPDPPVDRYWEQLQRAYGPPPLPVDVLAGRLDAYDGAITYLDLQVDSLLVSLANRGQLGNTIVVLTSDHGELFGEHGILGHGNNLYLPVLHIPLFFLSPGLVPRGARVASLASLRDLPATLLHLARIENPRIPGHSLAPLWTQSPEVVTDTVFSLLRHHPGRSALASGGDLRALVLDSLHYIMNGLGIEELFHLGRDSWEIRNLAGDPGYQGALAAHRAALKALPERNPTSRSSTSGRR
jgi:arylsulfatase A-like enzyme